MMHINVETKFTRIKNAFDLFREFFKLKKERFNFILTVIQKTDIKIIYINYNIII